MRTEFSALLVALSVVAARSQPDTNAVAPKVAVTPAAGQTADRVETEYRQLLADDDAAQQDADRWIQENKRFSTPGGGLSPEELKRRIEARFESVRKGYVDFLQRHPDHARARLAYGSLLNDLQDSEGAIAQWEKARELDPQNPAAWNNLANQYAERGPAEKAFEYYAKAIQLNPREPLYYHSLGNVICLFPPKAMKFYQMEEPQVFDKALELYRMALKLDPDDFPLATDLAQTYYGFKPMRTEEALKAWQHALELADDETKREGIYLHLARVKLSAGRLDEARQHLAAVTNAMYASVKQSLARNLAEKEAAGTNGPPPTSRP